MNLTIGLVVMIGVMVLAAIAGRAFAALLDQNPEVWVLGTLCVVTLLGLVGAEVRRRG